MTVHARGILVAGAALAVFGPFASLPAQLTYDTEYPSIPYATATPTDRVARLKARIDRGEVSLSADARGGYLASVLRELEIPVSSQVLVNTKTSFQKALISPRTPRAIYFNDDVYVAWVQGGTAVEIASLDPDLGPVFYTVEQQTGKVPTPERQLNLCLQCHDTYSLTGDGVPTFLMGSQLPDSNGAAVFHEGWYHTDDTTPFELRWGGWYVTGTHGSQKHMGNIVVKDPSQVRLLDFATGGNVTDLRSLIDTAPYLGGHSDIVALMVLEHQVHVHKAMIQVSWDARRLLDEEAELGRDQARLSQAARQRIDSIAEPLVRAMLLADEAPIEGQIAGTSSFATDFQSRGPRDDQGRSLRALDLSKRLFRYPLSYVVYSDAFDALPIAVRTVVYRRFREVLSGQDRSPGFARTSSADKKAILEILEATKPDFARTAP